MSSTDSYSQSNCLGIVPSRPLNYVELNFGDPKNIVTLFLLDRYTNRFY